MRRRFLMCSPVHFAVEYAINAWMTPGVAVDTALAVRQWEGLRDTYRALGHEVHELEPVPGLPDMVFAANGAFPTRVLRGGGCAAAGTPFALLAVLFLLRRRRR